MMGLLHTPTRALHVLVIHFRNGCAGTHSAFIKMALLNRTDVCILNKLNGGDVFNLFFVRIHYDFIHALIHSLSYPITAQSSRFPACPVVSESA